MPSTMRRRSFLRLALAGVGGAAVGAPLSACGASSPRSLRPAGADNRILLAYFSRPGENYFNGGRRSLEVGNTEVLAQSISARLDCDVHRIDAYDTILLASPIWNIRAPMIMSTFTERYDFTGKTVHPVTTHAMSGLGTTADDYAQTCRGALIATGLAVRGEQVRSAGDAVDTWLRRVGLLGGG